LRADFSFNERRTDKTTISCQKKKLLTLIEGQ